MCFMGGGGPDPAETARQQEIARAARVEEGTQSINEQFAKFDDPFFEGIEKSALDFFNPQVTDQFNSTREALTKSLARNGNLDGSVGARGLGDLTKAFTTEQANVGEKALNISRDARANVEKNRANLIRDLSGTADPFAAANAAAASAAALSRPPEFSPIADLFSKFIDIGATQVVGANRGFKNPASTLFGSGSSGSTTFVP